MDEGVRDGQRGGTLSRDRPEERRYSEEELALILARASEIQASEGSRDVGSGTEGFSLAEIRSIAAEAGIDPEAVTRAASTLGALGGEGRPRLSTLIFGGSGRYHLDVEVPGRLAPGDLSRILEDIRRVAEHQGETSEVLGSLEWKTVGQVSSINVNISPRGDRTSIQIVGDRSAAGAMTFTFPLLGAAILTGGLGAELEPSSVAGVIALVTGMFGGGFLLARTLWARGSERFRRRLTRLMEALSHSVETVSLPIEAPRPGEEADG